MSDKTRQFIRRQLDSYEERQESRDEEFAALVSTHIDALGNRKTLKVYLLIIGSANLIIWASAILLPKNVGNAFESVNEMNDRIGLFVLAAVFGLGLWLTYCLMRLWHPDIEDKSVDSELFGSVAYHARSRKRFLVWIVSVVGGVINVFGIVITVSGLSSN